MLAVTSVCTEPRMWRVRPHEAGHMRPLVPSPSTHSVSRLLSAKLITVPFEEICRAGWAVSLNKRNLVPIAIRKQDYNVTTTSLAKPHLSDLSLSLLLTSKSPPPPPRVFSGPWQNSIHDQDSWASDSSPCLVSQMCETPLSPNLAPTLLYEVCSPPSTYLTWKLVRKAESQPFQQAPELQSLF